VSLTVSFNGTVLPVTVTEVLGRGPLVQEVTRVAIPGRSGSYYIKKRGLERPLFVRFMITNASSSAELRTRVDELNGILDVPRPAPIVFSDEPGRTYYGILEGESDWEDIVRHGRGELPIICPDRHKYGTEKTVSGTTVTNGGNAEASPIITANFSASADEYKIEHPDGGFVRVIYNFVSGDVLEIDLAKRKVTINDNLQMAAYDWRSQPFVLMPGTNSLTATPSSGVSTSVKYRERWL
jgi:predicted phage tail component-like protein